MKVKTNALNQRFSFFFFFSAIINSTFALANEFVFFVPRPKYCVMNHSLVESVRERRALLLKAIKKKKNTEMFQRVLSAPVYVGEVFFFFFFSPDNHRSGAEDFSS